MASTRLAGRLNRLLSQFPGRFCAPVFDRAVAVDHARTTDADKRRELQLFLFRPLDQVLQHLIKPSPLPRDSAFRRHGARVRISTLSPSTDRPRRARSVGPCRRGYWCRRYRPRGSHRGPRKSTPAQDAGADQPGFIGVNADEQISVLMPSAFSRTECARSPARRPGCRKSRRRPRSREVSFQPLSLRNRCSDIGKFLREILDRAMDQRRPPRDRRSASSASSCFLAILPDGSSPKGSSPISCIGLRQLSRISGTRPCWRDRRESLRRPLIRCCSCRLPRTAAAKRRAPGRPLLCCC